MKPLALALVIIGAGALIFGIVDYGNSRTTIEVGSMSASISENGSRWMIALICGGIALIVGLVLTANTRRQS